MKTEQQNFLFIAGIIVSLMLVLAGVVQLLDDPFEYGYYTLLRFLTSAYAVLCIFAFKEEDREDLRVIVWGIIALVFQPFIKISFQGAWWVVDFLTAWFIIYNVYLPYVQNKLQQ